MKNILKYSDFFSSKMELSKLINYWEDICTRICITTSDMLNNQFYLPPLDKCFIDFIFNKI